MANGLNKRGYTLVELMVVLAIFLVVLSLTAVSFNRIVSTSGHLVRRSESNIEGMIGLEVLRADLESAGAGLAWEFNSPSAWIGYLEAADVGPDRYNDAPSDPPRAFVVGDNVGYNGSDYLAVKSTFVGMNATARKWSYITYPNEVKPKRAENELELGMVDHKAQRVVVLKEVAHPGGELSRALVFSGSVFSAKFQEGDIDSFLPANQSTRHMVYGVDTGPQGTGLRMPFNRADYYIRRPGDPKDFSARCAPNTGVLYKGVVGQGEGSIFQYPILDCVADLQVVFYLDTTGSDNLSYVDADQLPATDPGKASAEEVRKKVKEVRVYLLAHEGKKDRGYTHPSRLMRVGEILDGAAHGSSFDLEDRIGTGWDKYRWRLYTIVVQPKNLE